MQSCLPSLENIKFLHGWQFNTTLSDDSRLVRTQQRPQTQERSKCQVFITERLQNKYLLENVLNNVLSYQIHRVVLHYSKGSFF